MIRILDALGHALGTAGSMAWQVTSSLILGFILASVVQAMVRRQAVARLLGDDRPRTVAIAAGFLRMVIANGWYKSVSDPFDDREIGRRLRSGRG